MQKVPYPKQVLLLAVKTKEKQGCPYHKQDNLWREKAVMEYVQLKYCRHTQKQIAVLLVFFCILYIGS